MVLFAGICFILADALFCLYLAGGWATGALAWTTCADLGASGASFLALVMARFVSGPALRVGFPLVLALALYAIWLGGLVTPVVHLTDDHLTIAWWHFVAATGALALGVSGTAGPARRR